MRRESKRKEGERDRGHEGYRGEIGERRERGRVRESESERERERE